MNKIFKKRTEAPTRDNNFYYSDKNPYVKKGYGLPNCTCYACGRFAELHGEFVADLGYGNAEDWWDRTKNLKKGQKPQLGAIVCWAKGKAGRQADGAGHVAIVEDIDSDGNITISASNYSGDIFYNKTYKRSNNYSLGSAYTFQGFIYPNIDFYVPAVVPVARDETVEQIEVTVNNLRMREKPGENETVYGYVPKGIYNILDLALRGSYVWYKIHEGDFDAWIAYSKDWAILHKKVNVEKLNEELNKAKEQYDVLQKQYEALLKDNTKLKDKIDKIQKVVSE